MTKRLCARGLAALSAVTLVLLVVDHAAAAIASSVLVAAFPLAVIALATARGGERQPGGLAGGLGAALGALFAVLAGSFLALFALRGRVMELPWIGGLPLAAFVQLAGLWLAPLILVALAHALCFERFGLSREDLERLRRIAVQPSGRGASSEGRESPPEDST